VFVGLQFARAALWAVLAGAVLVLVSRHVRRGARLRRLASGLTSGPGSLEDSLRAATGDPDLQVAYPVSDRLVRADGRPVSASDGRARATLSRGGTTVAVLHHDPALLPVDALEDVLGPAARLALENERLTAEQLVRLDDVRRARADVVEAADTERRRLERALHDGAQQRLLALGYLIRLAQRSAGAAGPHVEEALAQTQAALDDLRELAHGLHPAVLTEAGLPAALRSLSDRSAVPLAVGDVTAERFPDSVELAAYLAVRDAVGHANGPVRVRAVKLGGELVETVDGVDLSGSEELQDRIGALGGTVSTTATGTEVRLPCGS
jgi:signal transduction histidine kinase